MGKILQFELRNRPIEKNLEKMIIERSMQRQASDALSATGHNRLTALAATVGTTSLCEDLSFGDCTIVTSGKNQRFLKVHDAFPFALERMGVDADCAFSLAAVYAILIDHFDAGARESEGIPPVQLRTGSPNKPHIWPDDAGGIEVASGRLAAGIACFNHGVTPDSLYLQEPGPYPLFIASFLDTVEVDGIIIETGGRDNVTKIY